MDNNQPTPEPGRPRRGYFGLVSGLVLLIIGIMLLAETYFPQAGKLYGPIILIVLGLAFIIPYFRK